MAMNASSLICPLSSPKIITPNFHKLNSFKTPIIKCTSLHSHLNSTLSTQILHKPQTPLFLKPPIYSTTSIDLHKFTTWAEDLISSVGSSFVNLDNGPDPTLLHKELRWFLDDAVCIVQDPSDTTASESKVIPLRESLDKLYKHWEERIVNRRPIQYIVGCEKWRDMVLCVEDGILIPRIETGEIVDMVDSVVKEVDGLKKGGIWADLGTGSGALAIGIARVLGGEGRVIATDVSPIALAVSKYNVERYNLQDIIDIREGSWFDPVMEFEGQLSGLISNPPYMPSEEINEMRAEACKHEPWLAMDGGAEGVDFLTYLCTKTATMLKPGGFFAFETNGEKQCKILADYLENVTRDNICNVKIVYDYAGIPRFVTGHRRKDAK